jgi:hypothetical protein
VKIEGDPLNTIHARNRSKPREEDEAGFTREKDAILTRDEMRGGVVVFR